MAALYRRYRPERFQDVIGQTQVTEPLRHALTGDNTHHAYLFSGPRGCGKTTSARILARCLNCAVGPTDTPCGECDSCRELSRDGGGSLDVVEIDAASHNGVDDARELRERAVFAPARDRFKIFILDEAHMVTQQGFNALLKIVEEPPEHVKFVFATTEPEKVLATIRSRTHHYPFRLVPPGELAQFLEKVSEEEGIQLEPGVLSLVIRSGGGSVRDTLSVLDQLIAGASDGVVELALAQKLLGFTPRAVLNDLLEAIHQSNPSRAFELLGNALSSGQDPRRLVQDFLGHLRDVVVMQATQGGDVGLFPGASESELEQFRIQAQWFSAQSLSQMADVVSESYSTMSGVTSPTLQLELLVAQLVNLNSSAPSTQSGALPVSTQLDESPGGKASTEGENLEAIPTEQPTAESDQSELTLPAPSGPSSIDEFVSIWPRVLESLASSKRSLWVAMAETRPVAWEGDVLSIGFPRREQAGILKKPQGPGSPLPNADLLRDAIFAETGSRVRFTIVDLPEKMSPDVDTEQASDWPVPASSPAEAATASNANVSDSADEVESESEPNEASSTSGSGSPDSIASRGEPVVRQMLGGQLIGEEILSEMSERKEADV